MLIVEDDEDTRELLRQALEGEGFLAVAVASARQALVVLDGPPPGVIVLDLLLPLMSGWEMLDWLAKRGVLSDVPVVIVSGCEQLDRARALHPRIVALLIKPVRIEALVGAARAGCADRAR